MKPLFAALSFFALVAPWLRAGQAPPSEPALPQKVIKFPLGVRVTLTLVPGDPVPDALLRLTREAGLSVVLSKEVAQMKERLPTFGPVGSPRQLLSTIAHINGLVWGETDGVVSFTTKSEFRARWFSHHEAMQEYLSRPKVAQAMAESKKVFFDALVDEEFTRHEALRLVTARRPAESDPPHPAAIKSWKHFRAPVESPVTRSKSKAKSPRVFEFEDKELAVILRAIAKEVGMSLVVEERIVNERPTVTCRIENKNPRDVIVILAEANGFQVTEVNGVTYVKHRVGLSQWEVARHESLLEYESRPDAARKEAKAKRALFDALLAAKFTREEALQLVMTHEDRDLSATRVTGR